MVGSDAGIKHQTQGWARTAQVALPAKIMPGRKAGKDHARSQCPLRGDEKPLQDQTQGAEGRRRTQGWQGSCQVAMPASRGLETTSTSDARLGKNGPGRIAGEDHAGTQGAEGRRRTQGWQGSCQVAMPASRG